MENTDQYLSFYQLIKMNLHKEPKGCFVNAETPSVQGDKRFF